MDNLDKDRIIDASLIESDVAPQPSAPYQTQPTSSIEEDTKRWAVLLHLSTLLGLVSFGFGLIVPIVLWQWKKTELPAIDAHGKVVANAILSYFAYSVLAFILLFVLIGFVLFWVLGILFILYPLIGAIKASKGEVWPYPLCFKFFK
ncbi:MAG: hypothetical protein H6R05_361 [Burkholderiaceae bacterium]|nr:hypothetical protein [Burkholderiaceae bacterium]